MEAKSRLYYFDVAGGATALGIAIRSLFISLGRARWDRTSLLAAGVFLIALVALTIWRRRAYTQTTPWLVTFFSMSAAFAVPVLFWSLNVVWFALAGATGAALLALASVARTKTLRQGLSHVDVFKLCTLAGGAVAALVLLEVGLRLAPGIFGEEVRQVLVADPSNYGIAHPYIGYLHRPNTTTIVSGKDFRGVHRVDALGFRNAWPWPEHPALVTVGDSVTFGYGVANDEAWPAIIGQSLPGTRIVNLGLIGAGPQQYLRVYQTFGVNLHPKLLLVGVFAANDFWDAAMFDRWLKSGTGGNYMVWRDFGQAGRVDVSLRHPVSTLEGVVSQKVYPILRTSRIYNLLRAIRAGVDGQNGVPAEIFRFADGHRLRLLPGDLLEKGEMARADRREFKLALEAFEQLDSLAARNGTHTVMVLLPSKEEVYLPLLKKSVPDITSALRAAFDARGIEYLNLAPAFRERAAVGERLFFEEDGHPNEVGYTLIAKLVLSYIEQHARKYNLDEDSPALLTPSANKGTPPAAPARHGPQT